MKLLPRPTISSAWARLSGLPAGTRLFSRLIGRMAPYSGTVGAHVLELGDGYCRVELKDKKAVRNHLRSIHAIALMNLGELATGLAVMHELDGKGRGIIRELRMEYLKKARGTITAEARAELPHEPGSHDLIVTASLTDDAGDEVAKAYATWRIDVTG
ncbi:MAG: hotdog fold domain-containing protein [Planctomycetota bacterium]